jgi:hypothetical protein
VFGKPLSGKPLSGKLLATAKQMADSMEKKEEESESDEEEMGFGLFSGKLHTFKLCSSGLNFTYPLKSCLVLSCLVWLRCLTSSSLALTQKVGECLLQ